MCWSRTRCAVSAQGWEAMWSTNATAGAPWYRLAPMLAFSGERVIAAIEARASGQLLVPARAVTASRSAIPAAPSASDWLQAAGDGDGADVVTARSAG